MAKNDARLNRINEELKKEISNVLTFELKNPNVPGLISVTKAKITPDFKYAKIYFCPIGGFETTSNSSWG